MLLPPESLEVLQRAGSLCTTIPDAQKDCLAVRGASSWYEYLNGRYTGAEVDRVMSYLGDLGFTGSLNDRLKQAIDAGTLFEDVVMRTVQISDVAGGAVGTATTTVDIAGVLEINQTTANKVLTLPTPTNTSFARQVIVANTGTAGFFMYGRYVRPGGSHEFLYVAGVGWRRTSSSPQVIAQSAVAVTAPANDTNENTLATITIPAGVIGANGGLRITPLFVYTNSGNTKTLRIRLGGTQIATMGPTTTASAQLIVMCRNKNDQAAQSTSVMPAGAAVSTASPTDTTVDTSAETTLTITAQKATGSETVTLVGYTVELLRFD